MGEQVYLGIDLGAESGRVIAAAFDGQKVRLDELHRFRNGPIDLNNSLRWDVIGLWQGIREGLGQAAEKYGSKIVSCGVDTWGVDYVLLSKSDEILGMPFNHRDERTRGMQAQAVSRVGKDRIFAETGTQFMEINTLYQLMAARQKTPDMLDAADRFLMMPDFFNWCLCGSKVAEFTNATTTQFVNPKTRDWSADLLRDLDLPVEIFPQIVAPGTSLGQLRTEVAEAAGLGRIDVIAPATHDTGSAVAAVPTTVDRPKFAYISSGTWSLFGVEVDHAIVSPQALALNMTNEGGVDDTYRLLKNVMGLWLVQELRRSFEKRGGPISYEHLVHVAQDADPFRSLINPNANRFLAPKDMPTEIQEFCRETNQPVPESEGALVRCALESLALKYRSVLAGLEELTGVATEVIHVVGGGGKNALLNRMTASACRRPVIAGPDEATVLGNVLMQARSRGEIAGLTDLRQIVANSADVRTFEPSEPEKWDDAYGRFDELCKKTS
ncbi:rhamnulokinase [Stratiformator vulcanicus]|uniref:Rhamnulokinase n=1 Tax=Stratiformator vulcanicus TaxID=2527980 RepID=A0A517QXN6_9PLAN|nr:rhamnulokinase family protein [Stratiformator vulcanicus]QDT36401.1 Rhamnulokinase [Stratiformator vulcanicus]